MPTPMVSRHSGYANSLSIFVSIAVVEPLPISINLQSLQNGGYVHQALPYLDSKKCSVFISGLLAQMLISPYPHNIEAYINPDCDPTCTLSSGGSRGAPGALHPPMGPNSFIFVYIFAKRCPRQTSAPTQWGWHPQWEILDPPLLMHCKRR